jgi:hypothetical protein
MIPITLLAVQKIAALLNTNNALAEQITLLATTNDISIPLIQPSEIVLSSVDPNIGDNNYQLTYPRICIYSGNVKNLKLEKFCSFSGTVSVIADIFASGTLLQQIDQWIHYYVDAYTALLRKNIGDWGDGVFFSGIYDVQFQNPKVGAFGFVESAKINSILDVSRN